MASLAVTSLVTNQGAKRLRWRSRPVAGSVPRARIVRTPTSSSMPSGHSASAAAFAVGVAAVVCVVIGAVWYGALSGRLARLDAGDWLLKLVAITVIGSAWRS